MVSNATASASSGTGSTSSTGTASTSYASYPILPPDPPLSGKEVDAMNEYASSLEDLFVNSKPLINMLTMLAEENRASARAIVLAIELHLRKVPSEVKLPVLYLIDSIIKNVGSPYNTLFNQNIVPMFCSVFEKGDERTRMQLFKLRQTWNQMLPISKLYALDVHVHGFDPAWPVQPLATMIHVNPKFLPPHVQGAGSTTASPTPTTGTPAMATVAAPLAASAATTTTSYDDTKSTSADAAAASLRENLRRKQKKLLELRQKKLELELLQTKEKLREQEMLQQQQQQLMQQQQLVQQQQLIQQQLTAAAATSNVDQKKSRRTSSKHSSSSGSSSSKPSISSELENKRTKLSQLLKQELAQAKLVAPVTLNTPTAPATVPLSPSTNSTVHSSTTATTAKVTPPPPTSIDPSYHTTTTSSSPLTSTEMTTTTTAITKTQQLPITVPAAATGMPATAVVATAPVMRIAPVSSQLLSAVQKRGAIRDPRLLRAQAQATADSAAAKPVVTSSSLSSKTTLSSSKSSSSTSVTSSSAVKITSATSSSKNSVKSNSAAAKSVTSSPSKSSSSSVVTSSPSKSTSKSSNSVTSLRAGGVVVTSSKSTNESGDELLVTSSSSKKSRTSGGGGSSASSQSQSSSNPPVTAVSDSVATTADVVVKTSSRSKSSSSRSSSAESAVASSKLHRKHHHHHQERAKMIDTVTEKDSLDLDRKEEEEEEPAAVDHQSQELDTPPAPAEPRIGQLSPLEAPPPPTSGGKRLSEERDVSPPTKKSKVMDRFDELFGGEKEEEEKEVMPPAPPPPSMTAAELKSSPSLTTDQMASLAESDGTRASGGGRWSKYKAVRQTSLSSEPYPAAAARTKNKDKDNKDTDRLGRPLLYRHGKDRRNSLRAKSGGGAVLEHLAVQDEYDSGGGSEGGSVEGGNSPARLLEGGQVGGGCSYILQQAESQFKNGSLSSTQYNQILKEMIELNELKKLDEARRKEEREHRRSRRKYRHHQKVDDQSEDAVQPAQPISEQNNETAASAGENTSKVIEDEVRSMFNFDMHDSDSDTLSDYEDLEESIEPRKEDTVNGDDKTVNDMDISPDEDSLSIKSGKESEEKIRTDDKDEEDSKIVYEPLQPPPMPPAFVSRRSSEEEEVGVKQEVKQENEDVGGKDVDLRQNEELVKVEGGVDVKKEPVLPTKQDVDNRLGFPPGIGLAALSPPHDSSGMVVKVPAVIDSTKDIDWRRPLVIPPPPNPPPAAPIPMETEVVESANSAPAPSRNPAPRLAPPPPEAKGGGRILPGAWGGPQGGGGAPWMMQAPLPCWGGPGGPMAPPGMHPSSVMPLRPPPIPPQVMFEPDSNVRLCRPPGPLPPPPLPPPTTPQQLVAGGPGGPGPPAGAVDLPPADLGVLESIADDTMKSIEIDGTPRDIRYYGNTAVVFLSWDDPREILFQSSAPRKLIIDDRQVVTLPFNAPYKEVVIDGHTYPVQIGGPTRELYVGNQFYQVLFGGPPISVALGASDRLHKLQLEGPPPPVRIGRPRRDMCLGKITLIVDARHHYTIYLDPKAQRFDLDGVPHIIRFVEALETTVINGVPFKFEFGGLPRPVYSRGKKHYVRLTSLPHGVVPGYVDILGMEGGRRGEPPLSRRPLAPPPGGVVRPPLPPHLLLDDNSQGSVGHRTPPNGGEDSPRQQDFLHDDRSMSMMDSEAAMMEAPPPSIDHQNRKHHSPVKTNPLDVLSTLLAPAATAPVSGFSYSLEKDSTSSSSYQPALSTDQHANKPKPPSSSSNPSSGENLLGDLSLQELFEKLVATGIVPTGAKNAVTSSATAANQEKGGGGGGGGDQSESMDDNSHIDMSQTSDKIEFVDFGKPQTLRVRQPGLIQQLYTGIQCSSCGVRFAPEQTIKYSQHLDWHFRQNRRERDSARMVHSRTWYYDLSDWTQFEEIEDIEERALSWFDTQTLGDGEGGEGGYADDSRDEAGDDVPSAACESGAVDVRCALCRDRFDIFYNEDKEEWHVRRALKQDNDYYHPLCWDDHLASMKTPPPEPEEVEKQEPITSITIDEDDSEEGGGGGNKVEKKEGEDGVKKEEEEEEDDDDVIIQEPEHKMEIIELLKDDDEEEEEEAERRRRNRMKEEEEGDESCSKLSSDKKDSEDGDSLKPPTDFHSILRNIKKEKIDVDALDGDSGAEEEVIDLDASTRRGGDGEGEGDDDEQPLINRPPPVVDTTQVKVACSIDGNVELDDSGSANMLAAPSKIKINISKVSAAVAPPQPSADQSAVSSPEPPPPAVDEVELAVERMVVEAPPPPVVFRAPPPATASMVVPLVALVESSQPPPPGEEPVPLTLKPRLFGNKLNELPPVSRGTELSGLCSIM